MLIRIKQPQIREQQRRKLQFLLAKHKKWIYTIKYLQPNPILESWIFNQNSSFLQKQKP